MVSPPSVMVVKYLFDGAGAIPAYRELHAGSP